MHLWEGHTGRTSAVGPVEVRTRRRPAQPAVSNHVPNPHQGAAKRRAVRQRVQQGGRSRVLKACRHGATWVKAHRQLVVAEGQLREGHAAADLHWNGPSHGGAGYLQVLQSTHQQQGDEQTHVVLPRDARSSWDVATVQGLSCAARFAEVLSAVTKPQDERVPCRQKRSWESIVHCSTARRASFGFGLSCAVPVLHLDSTTNWPHQPGRQHLTWSRKSPGAEENHCDGIVPVRDPAEVVDIRRWVSCDSSDHSGGIVEVSAPSTARVWRLTMLLHSGGMPVGVTLSMPSALKVCRFVKAVPNTPCMNLHATHGVHVGYEEVTRASNTGCACGRAGRACAMWIASQGTSGMKAATQDGNE